jgi:hypothetical protein
MLPFLEMHERQPSLAEAMLGQGALLDGRYRLEGLVHRSATATIHLAMHRNGSTAWLKIPVSEAYGEQILLESQIANALGSPLVVRDDGTTREGVPYLVLDPPDAETVEALRVKARNGARLPLNRVMTAGDALTRVISALHGMGYATSGFDHESVLVFGNGDVALLDLHALVAASPPGIAADVKCLRAVLSTLVADIADTASTSSARRVLDGVLKAGYPDVTALQAGWRAAAPEPIAAPSRRSGALSDVPSNPSLPALDTPLTASRDAESKKEPEASIMGFLRSGVAPSVPSLSVGPQSKSVMYDPIAKPAELPRLVQAASPDGHAPLKRTAVILAVALPVLSMVMLAVLVASWSRRTTAAEAMTNENESPTAIALPTTPATTAALPPVVAPTAPKTIVIAPPPDELEMNAQLTTDGAPPNREVFLDGKPIGRTPLDVSVPCGEHTLQMVAGAPKQKIDLPCGGARVVRYDAQGHWSLK